MKIISAKTSHGSGKPSFEADGRFWPSLYTVETDCDGVRFDFVRFQGGPWEVYSYPKNYRGVPRFVGHLPANTAAKLLAVVRRHTIGDRDQLGR